MEGNVLKDLTNSGVERSAEKGGLPQKASAAVDELKQVTEQKSAMQAKINLVESVKNGGLPSGASVTTAVSNKASLTRLLKAMSELNDAYGDLDKAEKEEAGIQAEEKMSGVMSPEEMEVEIEKSQEILNKLREQEGEVDRALTEKVIKRDQALLALKLQNDEFEKKMKDSNGVAKASQRVESQLADKEREFRSKMLTMDEDKTVLEALLDGMQKLNGVENINVPTETKGHTLPISVEFTSGVKAEIVLGGEDMRLENIRLLRSDTVGTPTLEEHTLLSLLGECRELAPPNDLRHAMFCLYSAPLAPMKLAEDIAELRKRSLVKANGPLKVEFTTSNGLVARLKVHDCYPNVPAGVLVETLQGGPKWTEAEVEAMKIEANSMCFSTVFFMYDYLCSKE